MTAASIDALLNDDDGGEDSIIAEAAALMGLQHDQARRLFLSPRRPKQYLAKGMFVGKGGLLIEKGTPEYLARVKERVEHFIATEGRE